MAQSSYMRSAPIRRLRHPLEESPLWGVLGSVLAGILALLVGLPVLLVICTLIPFCLLGRWLLLLIFWNRQSSATTQGGGPESVRGNDGRWLGSAWRYSVIHAVLIFEAGAGLDVAQLRNLLLTRVVPLYPRLTRRPVPLPLSAGAGHCWLPDSQFCIDRHVFAGPSMLTTEKQLQDYVGHLLGEGLSNDKPPWEMHVLQSVGRHQDTVAVLRVHQSVADGMALVRVLCHSLADCQVLHVPQRPHFGALAFTLNVFRACIVGPLTLLFWLLLTTEDCNVLTQRKAWSGQVSVTWSAAITLPKVTRIKQVTRSTVNCVLLSALAGAARRLLQGCGVKQPPDMKVVLPVDLRSDVTSPRISSRLGSKMAPVMVGLPVGVEGAVPRLWAMRRNLDSLRTSADPVVVYVATAALMAAVPGKLARKVLTSLTGKGTLQFSSLPGPTSTLLVGGHPLKGVYPLLPAQNSLGIAVSVFTYADQIYVAIISDSTLSPAASTLLHHLHCQIEILWQLLLHRRVPGESRSHILLRRADVTGSPVRELRLRLTCVQEEVQRLATCQSPNKQQSDQNSDSEQQDAARLQNLKIEFSELLSELRRRNSAAGGGNYPLFEDEELGGEMWRPRRRAMSCSSSRRSSRSFVGLLTAARPASFIESYSTRSPANPSSPIVFRPTKSVPGSARPSSYIEPHSSSSSSPLICRAAASECILPGAIGPISPVDGHSSSSKESPVSPIKHVPHMLQRSTFCSTNISVISEHPGEVRTFDEYEENETGATGSKIKFVNETGSNSVIYLDNSNDKESTDSDTIRSPPVSPPSSGTVTVHFAHNSNTSQSTNDCAIELESSSVLNEVHESSNNELTSMNLSSQQVLPTNISTTETVVTINPNNMNSTVLKIDENSLNATAVTAHELQINSKTIPAQNKSNNEFNANNLVNADSSESHKIKGPIESEYEESLIDNSQIDLSADVNNLSESSKQDVNDDQFCSVDTTSNQSVIDSFNSTSRPHQTVQNTHKQTHRDYDQIETFTDQHERCKNLVIDNTTNPESNTSLHSDETTKFNADIENVPDCVITISTPHTENSEPINSSRLDNDYVTVPARTATTQQTDLTTSISIPELGCSPSSSITSSLATGEQSIGYQAMETPETSSTVSLVSPQSSFSSTSISSVSSGKTLNSSSTFPPSTVNSPTQSENEQFH